MRTHMHTHAHVKENSPNKILMPACLTIILTPFLDGVIESELGEGRVSLQQLLLFFTGGDTIPPLGYQQQPELHFAEAGSLATTATCGPTLWLPTIHPTYSDFTKYMVLSLSQQEFGSA